MAEFAWSSFEPAPGEYRFDWMEKAVQLFAEAGIATVLGTPTAAPPAWLTHAHPDILAVSETGRRAQHGNRCHYCPTSPEMLDASRRIARVMAQRFGKNSSVIGWQIDNELNRVCTCGRCHALFQEFLKERYGNLEALNRHWSTAYWSQTYSAWEQIPVPTGRDNPGLLLEWRRFVTKVNHDFQKAQVEILREYIPPGVWISHNFMGWSGGFDHYQVSADLDLAAWDCYIGQGHHDYLNLGITHDLTRGFKRRNFWLMETQPGHVDWAGANSELYQWEARAIAWQAVAHGADGVLYWQWRSAPGGQEQYHGTLIDPSGRPRPFLGEVKTLGDEFGKLSDLIAGSTPRAKVAFLNDYESRWSIDWQRHHKDFDYVAYFNHFARPLAEQNVAFDVISADEPLGGYRLVVAPALLLLDEKRVESLKEHVRAGGDLVLTARCGMKDRYNALLPSRQPGPLAELAGVEVEDYYALDESVLVHGNFFDGSSSIWAERLAVLDKNVTPIAWYQSATGWLDGQPAVTVRVQGQAMIFYVGTWLDDLSQRALLSHILKTTGQTVVETPQGVELSCRRRQDGQEIYFLINHERRNNSVRLPWKCYNHLGGETLENEFTVAPYSVAVLTKVK